MNPLQSASESNWSCMTWTQTLYPVALTCSDPNSFLSYVVRDYAVNNRELHGHKRAHTCTHKHTGGATACHFCFFLYDSKQLCFNQGQELQKKATPLCI